MLQIDVAVRKLASHHPSEIMVSELEAMHAGKQWWTALQQIVRGDPKYSERAKIKAGVSGRLATVQQQVECLLDQATDPNILGRVWRGWRAYL